MANVFKPGAPAFSVRMTKPEVPHRSQPWHDVALVWLYLLVVLAFTGVMVLEAVLR